MINMEKNYKVTANEYGTFWTKDGVYHREDGPAMEYTDGTKIWWINGKLHREDGPAFEFPDGTQAWWLDGVQFNHDVFCEIAHLKKENDRLQVRIYWLEKCLQSCQPKRSGCSGDSLTRPTR